MQKESLEIVINEMYKIIDNPKIDIYDKIELIVNLTHILDPEKYEENIKVLAKHYDNLTKKE